MIKLDGKNIIGVSKGDTPIVKIYKGDDLVYQYVEPIEYIPIVLSFNPISKFIINGEKYCATSVYGNSKTVNVIKGEEITVEVESFNVGINTGVYDVRDSQTFIPERGENISRRFSMSTPIDVAFARAKAWSVFTQGIVYVNGRYYNYDWMGIYNLDKGILKEYWGAGPSQENSPWFVSNLPYRISGLHNIINADYMFSLITNSTDNREIDSNFGFIPISCTSMRYMFYGSTAINKVDFNNGYNVGSSLAIYYMFSGCTNLKYVDISSWDTKFVECKRVWENCTALEEVHLGVFDMSEDENNNLYLFYQCPNLTTITGTMKGIHWKMDMSPSPLTVDSAMVIINGIEEHDGSDKANHTLTLNASTYNSLSAAQRAQVTSKNWILAYN